jgi:SPP1 gp7 family putative phage head morphogenesis protein
MAFPGDWWDLLRRGVVHHIMPGSKSTPGIPIPVTLGVPLNEYLEDMRIWRSLELVQYEQMTAVGIRRLATLRADVALAELFSGKGGAMDLALRNEAVAAVEAAITGVGIETRAALEIALGATMDHEAFAAGEISAVWEQYRDQFSALPPWRVPPVAGFASAISATDPDWFMADLLASNQGAIAARARSQVLGAYLSGASVATLKSTLRNTLGMQAQQAEVMARTSLHRIARNYQAETYKQSGVVKKEKFSATLDGATCPVCGNYDGKRYELGAGPVVPVHEQCRCTYIPVTMSYRELMGLPPDPDAETSDMKGTRRSMDGLVPRKTTWADWLAKKEKQVPGFAKDVLGATKYRAWKAGDLQLGSISRQGKVRTLASLGLA